MSPPSTQRVLPPPPSSSLRSRRPKKKPNRLNINLGPSTSFGSASSAPGSPTGSSNKKAAARTQRQHQASAYQRSQTLDPELIRTADASGSGGRHDEEDSSWVSFSTGGVNSTQTGAVDPPDAGAAAVSSSSGRASPSFIATTDQNYDVTPPIHQTFLPTPTGIRGSSKYNSNRFLDNTNSPSLFSENSVAEAAFTLDGREEVEVSRFEVTTSRNTMINASANDDAPRDSAPSSQTTAPPPVNPSTSTSASYEGGRVQGTSSARPDWSDMATWMRAPIDAITDAVITPVLPPRFDGNAANHNNTSIDGNTISASEQSSSAGDVAAAVAIASSTSLPPRRPAGSSGGTPTIRPPRPSGVRAVGTTSPATVSMNENSSSSSDEQNGSGATSSSSSSSGEGTGGGGVAERRRTARNAQNTTIVTGISTRSPRVGSSRAARPDDDSAGRGRSATRRPSNAAPATPSSARGRSSSRVGLTTPGRRGRSTSRTRGPSTPASTGRRGRSASRGARTPRSTPTRGRSSSRTRTTPSRGVGTRGRSASRTPLSRTPTRGVPASPSAQSTGGLSRSGTRGGGVGRPTRSRTPSVSRTRAPSSPSASSTGGLSRQDVSNGTTLNLDLDDASVTSAPALRASGILGSRSDLSRSTNYGSSNSGRLSAGSLRRLDFAENNASANNRLRAESTGSAGTNNTSSRKKSMSFRKEGGLMEKLFGDNVSTEAKRAYLPSRNQQQSISSNLSTTSGTSAAAQPEAVHTRTLLTASVYHNQATGLWIATINTNQKPGATNRRNAAKYLKAFSFHTEREARESAYANAPPKMILFSECSNCFICKGKFAVFRRPSHCRNCGVCICSSCTTTWSSKMIPETYNMKKESSIKVCKSCNFLVLAFRRALLDGQYDEAIALYNTGNINLRCPFGNIKGGEVMYPIHCAAEGGNLDLLRWLVDVHYCPISLVRTGNKKPEKENNNTPIITSKGRSVLNIAMSKQRVEMMRYLVTEKNVSIYEIKDLKTSLRALEAVLMSFPGDSSISDFDLPTIGEDPLNFDIENNLDMFDGTDDFDDDSILSGEDLSTSSPGANDNTNLNAGGIDSELREIDSMSTAVADACIICYENSIDCVMTPCGHQICCLECSANLSSCPVCNSHGQFIRIFKP